MEVKVFMTSVLEFVFLVHKMIKNLLREYFDIFQNKLFLEQYCYMKHESLKNLFSWRAPRGKRRGLRASWMSF